MKETWINIWSLVKRIRLQSPITLKPKYDQEYLRSFEFHPDLKKVKQAIESGKIEE